MLQLNWKAAATVVTGATALAGWLATPAAPARDAGRASAAPRPAPVSASLEQEAARLAARIHPVSAFEQPARNPFRFPPVAPSRPTAVASTPVESVAAVPVVPAAPVFPFRLTGMASDTSNGEVVRTVVLSNNALGVVLAKVGEVVAGSYRIDGIDDDGVDVVDVRDGRSIRLTLGR